MIEQLRSAYNEGGIAEVLRRTRGRLGGRTVDSRRYQEKTAGSIDERWDLFSTGIPDGMGNALDIGSNLGEMAFRLASRGLWTIGIDSEELLVRAAQEHHAGIEGLGFLQMRLNPDNVTLLPPFDVVFLLSVHHHWINAHGQETTGAMLRALMQRTTGVLIFEGASRLSRYGENPPDFTDNDESSVTRFHTEFLTEYLGSASSRIEMLGKTRCLGEREPYRWSWAIHR